GETRRALPREGRAVSKQTASLWRRDAAAEFRVHVHGGSEDLPSLILAATDGCEVFYQSDDELLRIGRDLAALRHEGFGSVEDGLEALLDQASCSGREDDATIGLLSRSDRNNVLAEESTVHR